MAESQLLLFLNQLFLVTSMDFCLFEALNAKEKLIFDLNPSQSNYFHLVLLNWHNL